MEQISSQFDQLICGFPERLHPVSGIFLDAFLEGRMTAAEFQRFFSLPNSDYIPLAECLVRLFAKHDQRPETHL